MSDPINTQNISRAIADLNAIKATLENRERIYPGPIWNFFLIAGAIFVGSLLNYLIEPLRSDLVRSVIYIWTPLMIAVFVTVSISIWSFVKRGLSVWTFSMKSFQTSRIIMAPSVITLGIVLYGYGFELGTIVLFIAAANISIFTLTLPRITLLVPAILTIIGWCQMALGASGPLLGLIDGGILSLAIGSIGLVVGLSRNQREVS